jgi:asparagine synthase (glutamine-hydrolysing)
VVNLGLLEQATRDLPAPLAQTPVVITPTAYPITDWQAQRSAVEALVLGPREIDIDLVPNLADGVLLLHDPAEPGTWYMAVDGTIEYVIEDDENLEWLLFLRALDGTRSVRSILAAIGCGTGAIADLLHEALRAGLLTLQDVGSPAVVGLSTVDAG